jgi:ATP phosphoribosyltransferase
LVEVETIMQISAQLIVNQAAHKRHRADMQEFLDAFAQAAEN